MADYVPKNLEALLTLLNVRTKREAERHCQTLVIYGCDLAGLIMASKVGALHPYKYVCCFNEKSPWHLIPKNTELKAASTLKVGPLDGQAGKLFRKLFQTMKDRRVFAAHLFYTADYTCWHILYFDQRDVDVHRPHWEHGPHIHYANDTFHNGNLEQIWRSVCEGKTAFLKPLHVRFQQ